MYSEQMILARLEQAKKVLGWVPERHSIDEVDRAIAHFKKLEYTDPKSPSIIRIVREPTPKEKMFIRNEIMMCSCDADYALTRYFWLKDPSNTPMRFAWRSSQRMYFRQLQWLEEKRYSQEMMLLKARQQYMTTIVLLLMGHRILFGYGTNAVSASCDRTKSEEIAARVFFAIEYLPWWLKPTELRKQEGKYIQFANQCSMTVQSGNQASGIARGTTPTCVHLCLSPSTLIPVADGYVKPLSEIAPNDRVISSEGKRVRVRRIWKSQRSNELTSEIWLWGNVAPLSCTRDHPVMTDQGWQQAHSIQSTDYVRVPVRKITDRIKHFTLEVLPYGRSHKHTHSRVMPMSFDWGWLCGLYLAEGSGHLTKRNGKSWATSVYFSISVDEAEDFTAKLKRALGDREIGVGRNNSKTRHLRVNDAMLSRWIGENFGRTDTKRVPDWVWEAGRDFCRGIVAGYLEGDGHIPDYKNDIPATSVRVQIPVHLRDLIASLGYGWSALHYRPAGNYYDRHCRERWILYLSGSTAYNLRSDMQWSKTLLEESKAGEKWRYSEDGCFVEVEVERNYDGFSESFYDLEVESETHDFCTLQCIVHNSEVADYPDPKELIEASLFRAVHSHPKVFLMLESTGNSNIGWWAETWRKSKADWSRGLARLMPMFIPWWVNTELYPTETWLRMHPVPGDWQPLEETRAHMDKCRAYCRSTDYLVREFGTEWRLPIEQAWFWEVNYQEHKSKRIEREWLQEMPADDYEALQSRQEKVFPYEVLTRMQTERERRYDVYAVSGEGIEDKFYPFDTDIDYGSPRIPISWTAKGKAYRWQLIRLTGKGIEDEDNRKWNSKLIVYEYPRQGHRYSVGIDTASGSGMDRTVISVTRVEKGQEQDVQVAELASDAISAAESYAFVMAVCAWYDAFMVACEQVRKPGDICQLQMKQMGWPNSRVHSMVRYDGKKIQKSKAVKKGWWTSSYTRPLLLAMFIAAVENGWYKVNSKFLASECENFESRSTDSGLTKMEHVSGKHDDRVFAGAISYMIAHDLEVMIERSKHRFTRPEGKLPALDLSPCVMNVVTFKQIWGDRYPGSRVMQVPL